MKIQREGKSKEVYNYIYSSTLLIVQFTQQLNLMFSGISEIELISCLSGKVASISVTEHYSLPSCWSGASVYASISDIRDRVDPNSQSRLLFLEEQG